MHAACVRSRFVFAAALLFGSCTRPSTAAENLVPDPSFEAPTPCWFSEDGGQDYFASKQQVASAADGASVLVISGWNKLGSVIASRILTLQVKAFSGTMRLRSFGPAKGGTAELALFDPSRKRKLASFGSTALDGKGTWRTVQASNVALNAVAAEGVLGIAIGGEMHGVRVEVDQVGLFKGSSVASVVDTAEFAWFEAESMQLTGEGWTPRDEFASWYHEFPSGRRMLSGADGLPSADGQTASYALRVKNAGRFKLWTRFLRTNSRNHGSFTISLRQKGKVVASKEIADDSDEQYGAKPLTWVYTSLAATLQAGPVEVVLTRPTAGTSWVARKVDMFALTNLDYYIPQIQDYRAQGYVRFTNDSEKPFCLVQGLRRHDGPVFRTTRMWTMAGRAAAGACREDKRFTRGEPGPWIKLSDLLSPARERNNLSLVATTKSATDGYVSGRVKGVLEFAVGPTRKVVKTFPIDQAAPRVLLTVGVDFTSGTILSASEHLKKTTSVVAALPSTARPAAKYLDLSVILEGIDAQLDPPEITDGEIGVIKSLGFNGTNSPLTEPSDVEAYYRSHGLLHVGISSPRPREKSDHLSESERAALVTAWGKLATELEPALGQIERAKVFDEPTGPSYDAIVKSDYARQRFPDWLKARGRTLAEFNAKDWSEVLPAGPDQAKLHPHAYYWTSIYRLDSLADTARGVVAAKKAAGIPDSVKTYSNYAPTWGNASFVQASVDPFMLQRNGGFELGWTEDWLGYGVSTQHISDHMAIIRAAGAPSQQELGLYVVGVDGPPSLQRLRYYEGLAAGARHFCAYNYGPYYGSADSWGARYDVYAPISDALHDFGAIDRALNHATRRRSDVAIIYNRTAAIWARDHTAAEQDGRYLFWALSHAGYQPDFVPEEDLEGGALRNYKALYLTGTHLRRQSAKAIASWVAAGGSTFATTGAASRDEYDQPLDVLERVFGARSVDFSNVQDAGRPKYELRQLKPLGVLSTPVGSGIPNVSFNQLCNKETLTPLPGAKIALKNETGATTGVLHNFGKGRALRVAALPGLAYLNDAIKDSTFDIQSYRPTNYRADLRDFIAFIASLAHAERVVTNAPAAEVVRYDSPDNMVLIVVNHGAPVPNFEMRVAGRGDSGYSASGAPISVSDDASGELKVSFKLDVADAIVVSYSSASIQDSGAHR